MNFQQLTYKQKNKILLAGTILLVLISYFFSIQNTIDLYLEVEQQNQRLSTLNNYPQQLKNYMYQLKILNSRVEQYVREKDFSQDEILESLSLFCRENKLVIRSFPKSSLQEKEGFFIETHHFEVEGSYINLVKLLYQIEKVENLGRVASVYFESNIERKTKRKRLSVSIYLQNIRNKPNEK